jgi:excisionase family DNA binding protein
MSGAKFISEAELAKRLGVPRRSIATMRRDGRLPAITLNRKNVRYDEAEVIAVLKGASHDA